MSVDNLVTLETTPVVFVEAIGGPAGASKAFEVLESNLTSLKGRKFYGLISERGKKYLACMEVLKPEELNHLKLPTTFIPGGKYLRVKIKDWPDKLDSILPILQDLEKRYSEDELRPRIEFYRSQKDLILLFPIK